MKYNFAVLGGEVAVPISRIAIARPNAMCGDYI